MGLSEMAAGLTDALNTVGDLLTFAGGTSLPDPMSLIKKEVYPLQIAEYKFEHDALVQVKGRKEIKVTAVPGGNNTLKEIVAMNDYEINIAGRLICKTNTALLKELEKLIVIWNRDEAQTIECTYTKAFGIEKITIQDFEPIIRQGFQSVLWFTINGLSDNEIDKKTEIKADKFAKLKSMLGV